jgi:MoxR-like ATPase
MFNIWVDYPAYKDEVEIVKATTFDKNVTLKKVLDGEEIMFFQNLVRKIPVADNVLEYAVKLASRSRPQSEDAPAIVKDYIVWGAGPRASQFLVIGAKCHAALHGKYSPDIADVNAVAAPVLRHRIVRNYKAEAEGISIDDIIKQLLK